MHIDQKWVDKQDLPLLHHLGNIAFIVGKIHNVTPKVFHHSKRCKSGSYLGLCYGGEKRISVRIRTKEENGKWYKRRQRLSEILDVLAHELAHLKYYNHEPSFWKYARKLKKEVKLWNRLLVIPTKDYLYTNITKEKVKNFLRPGVSVNVF